MRNRKSGSDPIMLDAKTKLLCIFGNPVEHSLSPLIHNTALKHLGLNYVYVAFKVDNIQNAMIGFRELGFAGASVTIPFKVEVMKYLDEIDSLSGDLGSVNTIVAANGKLIGKNTDATAVIKCFEDKKIDLLDKNIFIIGSGGASRAISFSIIKHYKIKHLILAGIIDEELFKLKVTQNRSF